MYIKKSWWAQWHNLTRQGKHRLNAGPAGDDFFNCLNRLWNINTYRETKQDLIPAVKRNQFTGQTGTNSSFLFLQIAAAVGC